MSAEVKNVSETVRSTVQEVKETAAKVTEKLRKRTDEAKVAFGLVDQFGDELGSATSELRALLGGATNSPPSDAGAPAPVPSKKDKWLG